MMGESVGSWSASACVAFAARGAVRGARASLLFFAFACAQSNGTATHVPHIAAAPVLTDSFPTNDVAYPNRVRARGDVIYAVLPGYRPLTLDLYLPSETMPSPTEGFPLIVFVHGGAWMGGHSRHAGAIDGFPHYLAGLAARGYVVASVNYRLSGEARFPAALMDLKLAVRWLRSRSEELQIDSSTVLLWGTSAGGQLAALVGLACDAPEFELTATLAQAHADVLDGETDCVQGVALWYAPSDFTISRAGAQGAASDSPEARYFGCAPATCDASILETASPAHFVDDRDPPVLIVHGRRDEVVPFAHAAELEARLRAAGVRTVFVPIDGVGHSFIGATPEQTRDSTLLALTETESFFAEVTSTARNAGETED